MHLDFEGIDDGVGNVSKVSMQVRHEKVHVLISTSLPQIHPYLLLPPLPLQCMCLQPSIRVFHATVCKDTQVSIAN